LRDVGWIGIVPFNNGMSEKYFHLFGTWV
jgi:hypothetical protein